MRVRRALVIIVILAACGDKDVAQLEGIRDQVCACETIECGEAALTKVPAKEIKSNRRTQRIARLMMDCMARLYEQGRPSTDPDRPRSEPEPELTPPGSSVPASAGTR
jgi:hypothetical protein